MFPDGMVSLAELEQAAFDAATEAGNGKPAKRKLLKNWLRSEGTIRRLGTIAAGLGLEGVDSTARKRADGSTSLRIPGVLERGDGREPRGHLLVAVAFADWLHEGFGSIVLLELGRRRFAHRALPKADPALVAARKAAFRPLTDVLQEFGMGKDGYTRSMQTLAYELTGRQSSYWKKVYGCKNWIDCTGPGFQRAMELARRAAAKACAEVDLEAAGPGFQRHFNAAIRKAVEEVKVYTLPLLGLPAVPTDELPLLGGAA